MCFTQLFISFVIYIILVSAVQSNTVDDELKELENLDNVSVDAHRRSLSNGDLHGPPLKIGAFNIRRFGVRKVGDTIILDHLVQIVRRYDIILIQEITDVSGTAIQTLLSQLSAAGQDFSMSISSRLGRRSYKEQYAYLYREDKVSVLAEYQYPDPHDWYERPPYIVKFSSSLSELKEFALLGCHIKPSDSENELNHLVNVYNDVVSELQTEDVVMMGDFNADCSYLSNDEFATLRLRVEDGFTWILPVNSDTTVAHSHCAYDRIIVAGSVLPSNVVRGSAQPYWFDDDLGISQRLAYSISDHYPVEFDLLGKVNPLLQSVHTRASFSVDFMDTKDCETVSSYAESCPVDSMKCTTYYNKQKTAMQSEFKLQGVTDVIATLVDFLTNTGNLLDDIVLNVVDSYLSQDFMNNPPSIQGIQSPELITYDVTLTYRCQQPQKYTVTVEQRLN